MVRPYSRGTSVPQGYEFLGVRITSPRGTFRTRNYFQWQCRCRRAALLTAARRRSRLCLPLGLRARLDAVLASGGT